MTSHIKTTGMRSIKKLSMIKFNNLPNNSNGYLIHDPALLKSTMIAPLLIKNSSPQPNWQALSHIL